MHGTLTIDLQAIADNLRILRKQTSAEIAPAVKADAYGLGMEKVALVLWDEGCRHFFVAHGDEGKELRSILPDATISVLNGCLPGEETEFAKLNLSPVISSGEEIERWEQASNHQETPPAWLHFDTGINRLGLTQDHAQINFPLHGIMSHYACADDPGHWLNEKQIRRFAKIRQNMPGHRASMCNSSGIFAFPDTHFDLVRPGMALYGLNPTPGKANPMRSVVTLNARILQIKAIKQGETCGYGATWQADKRSRIAIISAGYADGYFRSASNRSYVSVKGHKAPVIGRVSMDLIIIDITDLPADLCKTGDMVQLIGPDYSADDLALEVGTIGYEVLTSLGKRYFRAYNL